MQPRRPTLGLLGAVHRTILPRPQRAQRLLLRLGESSNPRDVEPLVGAVASQRAQILAPLEVPEHNGSVIPATGEPAPLGTHLERLHHPPMGLLHPHTLSAVDLPPAQPAITASTDQHLPARTPSYRRDHPR